MRLLINEMTRLFAEGDLLRRFCLPAKGLKRSVVIGFCKFTRVLRRPLNVYVAAKLHPFC